MKKYVQSICLTRIVEDADEAHSKGSILIDVMRTATNMTFPDGFEISSVDAWRVKVDKDGNENRIYDE